MTVVSDSVIGDRYDPFGEHLADPYAFYRRARHEQSVFYSTAFQAWVVTRYDDVRAVLMHPKVFSSTNAIRPLAAFLSPECMAELKRGYLPGPSLINTDGQAHQRLRAPFTKALGLKCVRRYEPFIRERVEALVEAMLPAGSAEFMRQFAHQLPFRVLAHILGIDEAEYLEVQGSNASSRLYRRDNRPEEQLEYARQTVHFQHLMVGFAKARRAEPRDDLITAVVTELAPGDAPLTYQQEQELVWSLGGVVGSANSLASVLGMGTYCLLDVPERWAALVARPRMIGNAVEEICRYDTPAQTFARVTTQPVTLGGVDLPAGAEIMVMLGSANRDERLVERPEEFDITRPRMRHVTFGQGSHICLGAPIVRAVVRVTLETMVSRMPGLRLAGGHEVRLARQLNHRQPLELHITW